MDFTNDSIKILLNNKFCNLCVCKVSEQLGKITTWQSPDEMVRRVPRLALQRVHSRAQFLTFKNKIAREFKYNYEIHLICQLN